MSDAVQLPPSGARTVRTALEASRPARVVRAHWLRVPPASERVRGWHVGPAVDAAAYHWSWLWLLAPLLACGPRFPFDYAPLFMAVLAVSFVHRHFTLGTVYLDRGVFQRHRRAFTWAPLAAGVGLLATPVLARAVLPAGSLPLAGTPWPAADTRLWSVFIGIAVAAGIWNVWHTLMQKYGILRIYAAKAREEAAAAAPAWADRWLVLGWAPLVGVYLAVRLSDFVLVEYQIASDYLAPALAWLNAAAFVLGPLAALAAAGGVAGWLVQEWRANGLRNRARLSMAAGTSCLWLCFFVFDPIKVYIAFGFSHAVEYMVFVWAYQRRRYAGALPPRPLLARLLDRPWLTYSAFTLVLASAYVLFTDWRELQFWSLPDHRFSALTLGQWVFCWGVWQSFVHFYFDGLLWRTREPQVRDAL